MIPARYAHFAFAFFLSMIMSALISGVATVLAMGVSPNLPGLWFTAWYSSWIVAFPSVLVVAPIARRIVAALTKQAD